MPGGVNSPVRAFNSVGGTPRFIERGRGAVLVDVDGNEYVDFVCSWGALPVGHANSYVVNAIKDAAERGTSFGAPHEGEIRLAEAIQRRMPHVELVRCVNSGTEAVMSAIRLARGFTDRSLILKFAGCYHGHTDSMLVHAGSGAISLPESLGVTAESVGQTLVLPFNDLSAVEEIFATQGDQIAAVIVEPVSGNMGVVPPAEGFLAGLREVSQRHGALLIFDEVITGFRVSPGGAAELYDVVPDLVCLGKVIGGGLPVGAYGGRRDIMSRVAPLGPVYQAGTLSGNPLAMAAGLATLDLLDDDAYSLLDRHASTLQRGLEEVFREAGIPAQTPRIGSMVGLFLTDRPVSNLTDAFTTDRQLYAAFFHALLARGVYLPPSPLESWFVSTAHTDSQLDRAVAAFRESLREILDHPQGARK